MELKQYKDPDRNLKILYISLFAGLLLFAVLGWLSWSQNRSLRKFDREIYGQSELRGNRIPSSGQTKNYTVYLLLTLLAALPVLFLICLSLLRLRPLNGRNSLSETDSSMEICLFENTGEGMMIADAEGTIRKVNPAFSRITGYAPAEVIGKKAEILKSVYHPKNFRKNMQDGLIQKGSWAGEIWNRRKNGEVYPEWVSVTSVKNTAGETANYVAVFHDISELKQNREQVRFHAWHDTLTGLPNRTLFADRLERAVAYARRKERKLAVMLLDLDNFKTVNESLGHQIGDKYLQEVAGRLKNTCREEDTIARMGGDEFVIILPDVKNVNDAVTVAQRIRESFTDPVLLGDQELFISTSIGITFYPDDGMDADTLVRNADIAVYKAKDQGKDTFAIFTHEMNNEATRRIYLESSLRRALKNDEFRLFFQPKVELLSSMITGTEALIRWEKQPGIIIPPKEFIPLAEETGIILPLGRWVLQNACLQTKIWNDMFGFDLHVAVNLSARQFQQEDLPALIRMTLGETGIAPHLLNIEITENIVMENVEKAIETMKELSQMGIRISIDDFGTGYSSLNYLKCFPLDILKIDRTFVKDIPEHPEDMAIAKTILSLAQNLNLRVVAEGVENKDQLDFFRSHGCQEIQGYLFSKPLSVLEMTHMLKLGRKLRAG